MIRVMIVDDEILVRVGIKSIINWESNGYTVVCEAGSFKEAVQRIETFKPQIILTDLMMDGMDGFDLIEFCVEKYPNIRLVVLSSYNDFDHVKRAMKSGAGDYIFKLTVKPDELLKVLNEQKKELNTFQSDSDSIVLRNISAIKNRLITSAIQQNYTSKQDFLKEFTALRLKTDFDKVCVVLYISIDGYEGEQRKSDYDQLQLLKNSMENIISEVLCSKYQTEVYNYRSGDIIALIHPQNNILSSAIGEDFVIIAEYMKLYLGISVSGALSDAFKGVEELPNAVKQAKEALDMRFFSSLGRLYIWGQNRVISHSNQRLPNNKDLEDALICWNKQTVDDYLNKLFKMFFQMSVSQIGYIRMIILDTYSTFLKQASINNISFEDFRDKSNFTLYDGILKFDYLQSIYDSFFEFLQIYEKLCCSNITQGRSEILKIKQYVRNNLSNDLDVESAADIVHMSKSYFSHLFKKETGISYIDYINQTRISKAQELLSNTNMRIGDVAESVGIGNSNYFSILFKKIVGVSPGDYRAKFKQME